MPKKKVLIVDDEENFCKIVKLNLEEENYDVQTECKGINVLNVANKFQPDIILLDYIMPQMDGGDVLRQLQSNPSTTDIPVVFLTAIATKDDTKDNSSLIGGHHVLAKPITTGELVEAIEKLSKKNI